MRHTRTTFMENFNLIWCKMRARRACKVLHVQKCENSCEFRNAITLRPLECQFWNLACIFITSKTNSLSNYVVIECKMLVKRAREVCTCVTLEICTKLIIFIVENPIISLLWNFTDDFRYTQATISRNKQFLKSKVYAARELKVCTCKCVIFDYLLFAVCSLVSDDVSLHAWCYLTPTNETQSSPWKLRPLWLRGGHSFDSPRIFVVTNIYTGDRRFFAKFWKTRGLIS